MKGKYVIRVGLLICVFGIAVIFGKNPGNAAGEQSNGRPLRIGYVQMREYSSFAQQLLMLAKEFEDEGSVEKGFIEANYPDTDFDLSYQRGDTEKLWNAICTNMAGQRKYEFVRKAYFDMGIMDEKDYSQMVNRDDVDLMIVMGTAAGTYFKEHEKTHPYMVLLAADPIASEIVESEKEPGDDRTYALIDNTSYRRQIEAGYLFLHFKKLGIVYEDSEDAYLYSAIDSIREASQKLGFEILVRHVDEPKSEKDTDRYYRELKQAYRELAAEGMDTLYITVSSIDYENKLQELLEDFIVPHKIPTLAQDDVAPVQYGALFGVSLVDYSEQAKHVIRQMQSYHEDGVAFRRLDQVCECTPKIFLNYQTAQKIGFQVSFEDLQIIDSVYR